MTHTNFFNPLPPSPPHPPASSSRAPHPSSLSSLLSLSAGGGAEAGGATHGRTRGTPSAGCRRAPPPSPAMVAVARQGCGRPTTPPLLRGGLEVAAMEVSPPILSSPSSCSLAHRRGPAAPPTPPRRPRGGGHEGAVAVPARWAASESGSGLPPPSSGEQQVPASRAPGRR
jgi:hypothetical protein